MMYDDNDALQPSRPTNDRQRPSFLREWNNRDPGCKQLHLGGCASEILNVLTAGILLIDSTGQVILANTAATTLLRRPRNKILSAPIASLLAPFDELRACMDRTDERCEFMQTLPGGQRVYFGVTVSVCDTLYHGSEHWHLTVLFQDITKWKQVAEQHKRLLQMSAVSEVMPTILHELKNPLASIVTTVQVMMEELPESEHREELSAVLGEVRRMELTLQGIGLAGRELRLQHPVQIDAALRQALRILAKQAHHRGIQIHADWKTLPPLPLAPSVLRAVLFNLVTNAIQASKNGAEITCRAVYEGDRLQLIIQDQGVGMSPDTLARCRELFYTTKARGSGIGLALCHKVSHEAGGTLEITSREHCGTRVALSIPCSEA